jgi:hypothetical protein
MSMRIINCPYCGNSDVLSSRWAACRACKRRWEIEPPLEPLLYADPVPAAIALFQKIPSDLIRLLGKARERYVRLLFGLDRDGSAFEP